MATQYHKSGRIMWQTARQYGGLEWAWELMNPAQKTWKLHVRPRGNPGMAVAFDVPGEMQNDGSVLVALLATAQRQIVDNMQERVERINEQRRVRREAEFAAEQTRAIQARDEREPGGVEEDLFGQARSEGLGVESNRAGSPATDSEGDRASAPGMQSKPETPSRATNRSRSRGRSGNRKNSNTG